MSNLLESFAETPIAKSAIAHLIPGLPNLNRGAGIGQHLRCKDLFFAEVVADLMYNLNVGCRSDPFTGSPANRLIFNAKDSYLSLLLLWRRSPI